MVNCFLTTLVSALFVATLVRGDFDNPKVKAVYNKCLNAHPLPPEEEQHFKKKDVVPSTHNAKCLMACLLEEGKLVSNGKYSLENALILADVLNKDNPDYAQKAREIAQTCASQVGVNVEPDECEFAYKMAVCVHTAAKGMNLETPNF